MTAAASTAVSAVVVTYRPDIDRLRALLAAIGPQLGHVYVVDNGDGTAAREIGPTAGSTRVMALGANLGLAAAQNAGLQAAFGDGACHVLLLDQDSIARPGMVDELLAVDSRLREAGESVAAVGPLAPSRSDPGGFVSFGWFRYRVSAPPYAGDWVWCDMLIASGSLINRAAFEHVGPMDESLFIDKVDTEWCLRARARGYRLAGATRAGLEHRLGDEDRRHPLRTGRSIAVHAPFRYYYMARNGLALVLRPGVGWRFRSAEARRLLAFLGYFLARGRNGFGPLRMMARGLLDALRGRSGAIAAEH
jgi:rhamnosyltransferase